MQKKKKNKKKKKKKTHKEPGLASARVEVGVPTEEWLESTELVPTSEQLGVGVAKEAADICACKGKASNTDRKKHWHGRLEMAKVGGVVTRPDGAMALAAGEKGTRQNKGSLVVTGRERLRRCEELVKAVDVVHVTVLPSAIVNVVFVHRDLGTVEDRGLVHVVPCKPSGKGL